MQTMKEMRKSVVAVIDEKKSVLEESERYTPSSEHV
jgi:hypothetical protein